MDPITLTVGAGLVGAGWLLGRVARLKASPKQPKPVCMCGHHYGTHDPESGACDVAGIEQRWTSSKGYHDVRTACPCVRYTGPQPVEQFWVPPAADMQIITAPRPPEAKR